MGDNDSLYDTRGSKRRLAGFTVRLPLEEAQPRSQGQAWKRIPAFDSCIDAG